MPNSSIFIKKPRQVYVYSLWRTHCPLNVHLAIQTQHHVNGCVRHIGQARPRMRQCLRNCHRSENARMAPEPHLHAVEAGRLHSNQKCLHKRQTLSVNSRHDLKRGVEVDFFGDPQHVKLLCRSEQQCSSIFPSVGKSMAEVVTVQLGIPARHGTGSVGHLGHLSCSGHQVIILTWCETWVFPVFEKMPKMQNVHLKCWNDKSHS